MRECESGLFVNILSKRNYTFFRFEPEIQAECTNGGWHGGVNNCDVMCKAFDCVRLTGLIA